MYQSSSLARTLTLLLTLYMCQFKMGAKLSSLAVYLICVICIYYNSQLSIAFLFTEWTINITWKKSFVDTCWMLIPN